MGEIEPLVPWGELTMPVRDWSWLPIEARLGRKPLWCGDTGPEVVSASRCTGGGQSFIDSAARFGVDAFITAKFLNRPFIQPASRDCIFMLQVTMPLNVVVFAHERVAE